MSAQHATTTRKADRFAAVSDEELLRSALLGVAAGDCGQGGREFPMSALHRVSVV